MLNYRAALIVLGSLPLLLAVASFVAGGRLEVVVLRTADAQGIEHETKLWIVEHEGRPWLRGARARLGWLERLRANPRVEIVRDGVATRYRAVIVETPEARREIDAAMEAKYGWLDRWYGLIGHDAPIPIRLDPDAEAG
jgi:hypothetical protein